LSFAAGTGPGEKGVSYLIFFERKLGRLTALSDRARSALRQGDSLISLQHQLLQRYFRLERAERRLARRVRQGRTGSRAVHQLERERQRLGRDLHTGVGQPLTAIRLHVEAVEMQLPDAPPAVRQALERVSQLVADALGQVRALSHRLQPPEWQRLALADALRQLWDLSGIPQRFDASLRIDPLPGEPGLELKILAYRAAQEAFFNLAQHARATRVEAALEVRGGRLFLTVRDNGAGFDAPKLLSAPASLTSGIGLRAIREQAAGLGAQIDIQSGPAGTTLELSAPFPGAA
jgi:two-component system NarL family sensor kinase